ncbi:MAG: S-formylglutathione hydrolase [Pseudomonadota bacterium]
METVSENACFGGVQGVYKHQASSTNCEMTFAVYMPPMVASERVACLWYLSGLTCTHENAMTKAMAQAFAAENGVALIFPDTSPRGEGVANDEAYDLGQGAGFYVDATEDPWAPHFQMYSYITQDLQKTVIDNFAIDADRQGVTGHSMGGHGAITLALKNPEIYRSLSAFAPIANPTASDWGRKQLGAYLGADERKWTGHDATLLVEELGWSRDMLIDQGAKDDFLDLLKPEALSAALSRSRTANVFRMQPGYDHSYFFVASFIEDHIRWHAARL